MKRTQTNKVHSFKRSEASPFAKASADRLPSLEDHDVVLTKLDGDGWVLKKRRETND